MVNFATISSITGNHEMYSWLKVLFFFKTLRNTEINFMAILLVESICQTWNWKALNWIEAPREWPLSQFDRFCFTTTAICGYFRCVFVTPYGVEPNNRIARCKYRPFLVSPRESASISTFLWANFDVVRVPKPFQSRRSCYISTQKGTEVHR